MAGEKHTKTVEVPAGINWPLYMYNFRIDLLYDRGVPEEQISKVPLPWSNKTRVLKSTVDLCNRTMGR